MSKEFIWNLDFDGREKIWRCILEDGHVLTYEGESQTGSIPIANPERKKDVLQIDTSITVYGQTCQFQLENGVPYLQIGGTWTCSATTFAERKEKLLKTNKTAAYVQLGMGILLALICLVIYLVQGSLGSWWILLVLGSIVAISGFVQYQDVKNRLKTLENEGQ